MTQRISQKGNNAVQGRIDLLMLGDGIFNTSLCLKCGVVLTERYCIPILFSSHTSQKCYVTVFV